MGVRSVGRQLHVGLGHSAARLVRDLREKKLIPPASPWFEIAAD